MSSATDSSSFSTSDIVGIVIGGVLGLATVVGLIFSFYMMCCKKNKKAQVWAQPNSYYPPNGGYGQPMNTGYGQPMNTSYGQPMNTSYGQPMNTGYGQPMNTGYYSQQPINNDQPPDYSSVAPGRNSSGKN